MATKTGAKNHTHQYYRDDDKLWHCALCSHFVPKNIPERGMINRKSICWSCEKEFELNADSLAKNMPTCEQCTIELKKTEQYLREKGLL